MFKGIRLHPQKVSITLDIPWPVAELLVTDGPEIIQALASAMAEQKASDHTRARLRALHDDEAADRVREWSRLAEYINAEVRNRFVLEGKAQSRVLSELSEEFGEPYSNLQALLTAYRATTRRDRLRKRDAEIIRLHFLGYSNRQIAKALRPQIGEGTVSRVLSEAGPLLDHLRRFASESETVTRLPSGPRGRRRSARPTKRQDPYSPAVIAARKESHRQLGIQFYRQLRRTSLKGRERWQFFKSLAEAHGLNGLYVEHLCSRRRRKVQGYLRNRREQTIGRLRAAGLTYRKIAPQLGLHPQSVARIHREAEGRS